MAKKAVKRSGGVYVFPLYFNNFQSIHSKVLYGYHIHNPYLIYGYKGKKRGAIKSLSYSICGAGCPHLNISSQNNDRGLEKIKIFSWTDNG